MWKTLHLTKPIHKRHLKLRAKVRLALVFCEFVNVYMILGIKSFQIESNKEWKKYVFYFVPVWNDLQFDHKTNGSRPTNTTSGRLLTVTVCVCVFFLTWVSTVVAILWLCGVRALLKQFHFAFGDQVPSLLLWNNCIWLTLGLCSLSRIDSQFWFVWFFSSDLSPITMTMTVLATSEYLFSNCTYNSKSLFWLE